MKNKDIIKKLNTIHNQSFSLKEFDEYLQNIKDEFVSKKKEKESKQIWIYQTIIEIHSLYRDAFSHLENKEYYKAWCLLERIEITISSLKTHFKYNKSEFKLWHIERSVKNLQVVFPYRLFMSSELLKKKKKCSVCDKEISIRNFCGHKVGEIYNGEMCHRIVTEVEVLGMSIVQNPGNKFSVMFISDEKTGKQIDQYDYTTIDYLFNHLKSPYEFWDLEVSQRTTLKQDYGNIGRNEPCLCGSEKKFKKCCGLNIGKKHPHYEFILQDSSEVSKEIIFTNTLKGTAYR